MARKLVMLLIVVALVAILTAILAGTAYAAAAGHGGSSDGESPQYLHWGWDESLPGHGEPGDGTGPAPHDSTHCYGKP